MACGDDAPDPTPDPTPTPATCIFFSNAGIDSGYTCTDGKSCTLDAITLISLDQDGFTGCDSACDPNGMDKDGAACTSARRLAA